MKNLLFVLVLNFSVILGMSQNMDTYHDCPMQGKVSDRNSPERKQMLEELNMKKNRYKFPKATDFDASVTLEKMLNMEGKPDAGRFNENKAATIEGYIVYAAKKGSVESCNCKATQINYQDMHIELALTPDEPKDGKTITVEITPRLRELKDNKGIDWTHAEIRKLLGKKVRVSGWLFYDKEHEKDACSYSPEKCGDVEGYNRHTCWEIHPVTDIEDLSDEEEGEFAMVDNDDDNNASNSFTPSPRNSSNNSNNSFTNTNTSTNMEAATTPMDFLIIILLGAILGMVGQGIRVVVGIKKIGDEAVRTGVDQKDLIKTQQIVLSLFIAFAIGSIAGVLAAVGSTDLTFTKTTIISFIAAGYAGTDFIEGFMKKNPSVTKPANTSVNINV